MIVGHENLLDIRAQYESVALRIGCFDLFHQGHRAGLDFSKQHAEALIVGVLSDDYVRRRKGPDRPVETCEIRTQAVNEYNAVDYVLAVSGTRQVLSLINKLRPAVLIDSQENRRRNAMSRMLFPLLGIEYVLDTGMKIESTTDIIARRGRIQ